MRPSRDSTTLCTITPDPQGGRDRMAAKRTSKSPKPPKTYDDFVERFPELVRAWEAMGVAARASGPIDDRTARLVKLGVAIGAQRFGAVQAAVRHARAAGVSV